jgi:maltooligosyltrehalose trehalohydrolase
MLKKLGADILDGGNAGFLVWAPFRKQVQVRTVSPTEKTVPMERLDRGYFEAVVPGLGPDTRYMYVLDGDAQRPDPASCCQPEGVHGPSQVIDHGAFPWEDRGWQGLPLEDYLIYELHTGTFTPEGTFEAIIPMIPYLKELGITAVEIMPVAQFPGARNWGYDGVFPFAVQNTYGGPRGLKTLVNECHKAGLAVIMDVVYNHLGPEGNYLRDYGSYFTDRYKTPWGEAVNFDGPYSDEVRRYFIDSALHWFQRHHVDALRVDAVHGIFDFSARHFLDELRERVQRGVTGRRVYVIAESDLNDVRIITPHDRGGYGLDAQWNDDFHHALHTLLTGEDKGYYKDFGSFGQMVKALREGFVYSGQYSEFRKRRHGSSSADRPARQFVVFSQNHDQVGNRMLGDRLSGSLSVEKLKLAAGLVLLSPNIPLLFMGEEYGEKAPFQYFVSHTDESLVDAVRKGRREEFSEFQWEGEVPDPQDEATFQRSKIDPGLRLAGEHKCMFDYYRTLIRLRKELPPLRRLSKRDMEVRDFPEQRVICLRRWHGEAQVFCAASFNDEPVRLEVPFKGKWHQVLDSSSERWAGRVGAFSGMIEGLLHMSPYSICLYRMGE